MCSHSFNCLRKSSWIYFIQKRFYGTPQKWIPVVGLEIHAQISSKSKLFSSAGTDFAMPPNMQVSFIDAALPGTLPVLNRKCVEAGVQTALALNCNINKVSSFDRKHYFYSDLPAGYQITQQHSPIATDGFLEFITYNVAIGRLPQLCKSKIKQIQLEQDSGKSMHDEDNQYSLIDLNRAGMGLLELVFEPDLNDGEEAACLVKELCLILQRLGVCSCKMDEGALRIDANISIHQKDQPLGVRTEVKNLNSIRSVQKAIDFEIKRQIGVLEKGGRVINQTMSFDAQSKKTIIMREKETFLDYRFMPEPNLPPLRLKDSSEMLDDCNDQNILDIHTLRNSIPIMPNDDRKTLLEKHGLTLELAITIVNQEGCFNFFNKIMEVEIRNPKLVANWLLQSVLSELNEKYLTYSECPVSAETIGEIIDMVQNDQATSKIAKVILNMKFSGDERHPLQIMKDNNWWKIFNESEVESLCLQIIKMKAKEVKKYQSGNKKVLNKLVKEVATLSDNRVENKTATECLEKLLNKNEALL